jgi:heat shock protein HtpX
VTAPLYIVNPLKKKKQMKLSDLTSTHPPISERIKILRNMSQGASFKQYSDAFTNVTHNKTVVPIAALSEKEDVALRQAGAEATKKDRLDKQTRQVGDIMRRVNQFIFLTCACGLKLKIPPNFKGNNVKCPRCSKIHDLPRG